jgi:hypothetical protein
MHSPPTGSLQCDTALIQPAVLKNGFVFQPGAGATLVASHEESVLRVMVLAFAVDTTPAVRAAAISNVFMVVIILFSGRRNTRQDRVRKKAAGEDRRLGRTPECAIR